MLYEKYRPKTWEDLCGQERAVSTARRIIERDGFDRGAFFIDCAGDNNSGVGKTSIAWLIAHQLADDFFIQSMSGSELTMTALKEFERSAHLTTWSTDKPFRVLIVNEAHAVPTGVVDRMLEFLECLPTHSVVILTTTRQVDQGLFGDDCGPFASRCVRLKLTNQGLAKAVAPRLKAIAQAENLDGHPEAEYVKLMQKHKNNVRACLQAIESGAMMGESTDDE